MASDARVTRVVFFFFFKQYPQMVNQRCCKLAMCVYSAETGIWTNVKVQAQGPGSAVAGLRPVCGQVCGDSPPSHRKLGDWVSASGAAAGAFCREVEPSGAGPCHNEHP